MKAVLCQEFGGPQTLVYTEEAPEPALKDGHVRIAVRACGVNFPDVLMIQGLYQVKPPFPFSPGLEVAGDVLEVGEGVKHLKPGDRVIAVVNHGGYAAQVVAPAAMALPMPPNMPYEEGAVFPLVYGTSHVALERRAGLRAGETLLVLGAAGGVGLTAVELGKQMGATVIAAASTPDKLALAREYGADHTIQYTEEDLRERVQALTEGRGADVIYDPVGGDLFDTALRCMAWEGRLLVIGFASGRIPEVPANRLLLKSASLVGVFWGGYALNNPAVLRDSFQTLLAWYAEGRLRPHIGGRYPLAEAGAALQTMMERRALGKLVLVP